MKKEAVEPKKTNTNNVLNYAAKQQTHPIILPIRTQNQNLSFAS